MPSFKMPFLSLVPLGVMHLPAVDGSLIAIRMIMEQDHKVNMLKNIVAKKNE